MFSISLSGCTKTRDLHYYLVHPLITVERMKQCQQTAHAANQECQPVAKAFGQLSPYLQVAWQDKQAFGWDLLQKQVLFQQLHAKIQTFKHPLDAQQHNQSINSVSDDTLRVKRQQMQDKMLALGEEISLMLAIIRDTVEL